MTSGEAHREDAAVRRHFRQACAELRPDLHRFCTRMTGSPCDGEDVLQDALLVAFDRIAELRSGASFRSWLFRIAHNRCVDFLRAQRRHDALDEEQAKEHSAVDDDIDRKQRVERALSSIVTDLPHKERASIVLKDVLDMSLEEVAEITESNVGAVKIALHRARTKLEAAEASSARRARACIPAGQRQLVERYIDAFNRRDWDAVRSLVSHDARLEVVQRSEGPFRDSPYLANYEGLPMAWRFAIALVDGVEEVVQYRQHDGQWAPHAIVRLTADGARITRVRDYVHVEGLLRPCAVE